MTRNITYLLGAGASYHAIPVVEALNDRMKIFIKMCESNWTAVPDINNPSKMDKPNIDSEFYKKLDIEIILRKYKTIIDEALKHKTVDTYAKKLFLQEQWNKLYLLKEFLCLYFAFEQSSDQRKLVKGKSYKDIPKDSVESTTSNLFCNLDYRYDVFLASLLDKNMKLPSNINIISWNYDHQLELAYMDYAQCSFNDAKTKLKIYPHEKSETGQIVKLNGSANQMLINGEVFNFQSYETKNDLYIDVISDIERKYSPSEPKEYALNFAWEGTPIQKKAISLAKEIMENTHELIIIGYSFPYFNRSVDIDIINKYNAHPIKVQCLERDFRGIKQSIIDIFGEDIGSQIHFHDDLSQFYIPSVQFSNNNN